MPGKTLEAGAIRRENVSIRFRSFFREPGKQGGPKIKIDGRVVVYDLDDSIAIVQDSRRAIRRITFRGDPLVPIVIRIGRILLLYCLQPSILARGLVEMAVDAQIPHKTFLVFSFLVSRSWFSTSLSGLERETRNGIT